MGDASTAGGFPGPTDAWTTLAGLARDTSTIRLGTLVIAGTFRHPGRAGDRRRQRRPDVRRPRRARPRRRLVRAGAHRLRHPVPGLGERFDRLDEQLEIVTGLWSTPTGRALRFRRTRTTQWPIHRRCPSRFRQVASPIIVGGGGKHGRPALAARFATEFNLAFRSVDDFQRATTAGPRRCAVIGRDPARSHSRPPSSWPSARRGGVRRRAAAIEQQADEFAHVGNCRPAGRGGDDDATLAGRRCRPPLSAGARPR